MRTRMMDVQGMNRVRQPRFRRWADVLRSDGEEVESQGRDRDPSGWDFGTWKAISDTIAAVSLSSLLD